MSTATLAVAELDAFSSRNAMIDELVRRAADVLELDVPSWRWVSRSRGNASSGLHAITLPDRLSSDANLSWDTAQRGRLYLAYYVLHEVAHLPSDSYGHAASFKAHERHVLEQVLGVSIGYQRAYPAKLVDVETKLELYVSASERRRRMRVPVLRRQRERVRELLAAGQQPERVGYMRRTRVGLFDGEWLPLPR